MPPQQPEQTEPTPPLGPPEQQTKPTPAPEALMSILGSGAVMEHVGAVLVSGTPQQAVFQQ